MLLLRSPPEGVPTGPPMPLDAEDVAYVRREFMSLEEACIREGPL